MKVRNCVVIVWLLYGYCVVRMVKIVFALIASNPSYPNQIACRLILFKDTTKFSIFQIFRGLFCKKIPLVY